MKIGDTDWPFTRMPCPAPIWRGWLDAGAMPALARAVQDEGGLLIALWGSDERRRAGGFAIHVTFLFTSGLVWASSALPADAPAYPDLAHIFPQAGRMQRATRDLLGIAASDAQDDRKWLRHGAWPNDVYPLRKDVDGAKQHEAAMDAYPFVRVAGDGVHEIPVGPIHAGVIEPGHFRFSIIGDRVLRLEERLGYTHKGIEKRFENMRVMDGVKLAGRVSGDTHSAFSYAYCMAVESATGTTVPGRAVWLRALFLEIERISNHLGDLGYLGNDVSLTFAFMQFWRLKEEWLRLSNDLFGHRYLYDRIVPGGVAVDLNESGRARLQGATLRIEAEVRELKKIYDEHAVLQDRFANTGIVGPDLAVRLGLTGLAGRASGQAWDARAQFPVAPYDALGVKPAAHLRGDVLARADVRFVEVFESMRLIRAMLKQLPAGTLRIPLLPATDGAEGMGWVEGWRGEVIVSVRIGANDTLDRVHPHDCSWQNWPLLEVGVLGNIVPDFPLINKSFNLSYSGQDL